MKHRLRTFPLFVPVTIILLVLAGIGMIVYNERVYQAQKQGEAGVQAAILAASVTAALDFSDPAAGADSVNALAANPQVLSAMVRDAAGQPFARFARSEARAESQVAGSSPVGIINVDAPVLRGGTRIGSVHLTLARESTFRRFTRVTLIILFVVLAVVAVGVIGYAYNAVRRVNAELVDANGALKVQMEEREKAEEQLRQAQKMQALGQLTGGIAHDFNNLLTVIQGSADILQRPNLSEDKRSRFAAAISQTAARAAALTSQLLSFARRQPLRPETLDINEQIVGMVDLLDRTLGERVVVKTDLGQDLSPIEADPVQLESAILNVAVNGRDAMPDGGTLTLATRAAQLGEGGRRAVAVAITDTGSGMDAETLSRVFEPFFTTKAVGRGTGLGLSQVYGFASQSGGEVTIDSDPGRGTTVTLIIPCSEKQIETDRRESTAAPAGAGTGRILVVDDKEEVGAFAEELLGELGYQVVRATSGEEALAMFDPARIDVVFSDVVMPGMSGIELARQLRERAPGLPIVLTTGFSNEIVEGETAFPVLPKPYKVDSVVAAIERARSFR